MERAIEVIDVSKRKGKKEILHKVNFNIDKGEIVGFLGANGAGKTTTLKCILGLYRYEGVIKIYGDNVIQNREKVLSKISGLIEEPCFYPQLSGEENLKINGMYYGKSSKENLNEIITKLKLNSFLKQKVKTYSLGMKQRLGIALALMSNPEIILLDEPMNGLDPDGIMELRNLLKELAHDEKKTILVSSHILSEMQMLCDRVIFIKEGHIVGNQGVSGDLEEQYTNIMKGECKGA